MSDAPKPVCPCCGQEKPVVSAFLPACKDCAAAMAMHSGARTRNFLHDKVDDLFAKAVGWLGGKLTGGGK